MRADEYPVVEVDPADALDAEQLGAKRKTWFRRTAKGQLWLFKADERVAGGQSVVGVGEDWSEKIACEICKLLGIPHVDYELAVELGTQIRGVVCLNIATDHTSLVLGNQLMFERDPSYPADEEKKYGVREHTIEAVAETVQRLQPPPREFCDDLPSGIRSAIDVFIGYVMLDALVANQDRHHQNWAALRSSEEIRLAPTFDHGASLARNEPDEKRSERLHSRDRGFRIESFAEKAKSGFYAGGRKSLGTLAALEGFANVQPSAARQWLDRLDQVPIDQLVRPVQLIPQDRMSSVAREFTTALLRINRERLLSCHLP